MAEDEDYLEPEEPLSLDPAADRSTDDRTPPVSQPPAVTAAEASEQKALLAEHRLAEVLAAYRKLKADHEGFRERTARNLERRFDQRLEQLLVKFIDVLDNFDRALEATEQTYAGEPLIEGLILVRTQLLQILQQEGLERIPVLGAPFDPHVAEAVGTQPTDDPDQHHIVAKEYQRGYRFRNNLVRASRVIVLEYHAPDGKDASDAEAPPESVPLGDIELRELPIDDSPLRTASSSADADSAALGEELSLDDIIARAEAQRALFPEAFDEPAPEPQAAIIPPDDEDEQESPLVALSDDDTDDEAYTTLDDGSYTEVEDDDDDDDWKWRESK